MAIYTQPTITGYNGTPPPDDGSTSTANLVTWAGIKTKIGDPLKSYADAINSAVNTTFGNLNASSGSSLVGFTQSGTGAIATTVQAILRGFVMAEMFGAVGDGTTDDTTALLAVIATGKNILGINGKTYKFTSKLTFSTTYQVFDLNGATLKPVGTFTGIDVTASNSGFVNGIVDCSGITGNVLINSVVIQQMVMNDVIFLNPGSTTAIILKDIYTSWLRRITITGHGGIAFQAYSTIAGTPVNSLWLEDFNISGGTAAVNSMVLQGVAGVRIINPSFQNNATGGTDIRITSDSNNGVTGVTIEGPYFETGINETGNNIYIGDPVSGANDHTGVKVIGGYYQSSKQNIKVGTNVNNDLIVTGNAFVGITGSPSYAMSVPAGFVPNVYDNTGSTSDLNRAFTPGLQFGGAAVQMAGTFSGRYKRIANLITGEIKIILTAKGSSTGSAVITGLPLVSNSNSFENGAFSSDAFNMASLSGPIIGRIPGGTAAISLANQGAAATTDIADTNFTNTSNIYVAFSYEI